MRVMIVDDDPIVRSLLRNTLTKVGYTVEQAEDGQQALAMLRKRPCPIVISDWEMPGMTGLELCHKVRNEQVSGYSYFIMLTSRDQSNDVIVGLTAGADDYIAKPFNPAELAVRVKAGERLLTIETREMTIFAMAKLAEARDTETGTHLERVRSYSTVLARELAKEGSPYAQQIDAEFIRLIYLTSPLHDIGKIAIPDSVLLKPGYLNERERQIMHKHTTLGAEALEMALSAFPNTRFLEVARDIALSHHERFDGTGYPIGSKGQDIPLAGRIVALADVYDALTTKRRYKEAFDHYVSRSIIVDGSGSHFDPAVVDAFSAAEEQFLEIVQRPSESAFAA